MSVLRLVRIGGALGALPVVLGLMVAGCCALGTLGCDPNSSPAPNPAQAPAITTQPTAQTVSLGQSARFTVVATGTAPLTYQWAKDGTPIPGAGADSYALPATGSADAGAYTVRIVNAAGAVTSAAAILTVNLPVTLTTQPQPLTVAFGQTVTFTVAATGTGPLTYQWNKADVAIPGATGSTLTLAAVTAADAGSYTVTVGNALGRVTSTAANLTVTVTTPVTLTTQPQPLTVAAGQTATFTVAATGTGPLTYQWNKAGVAIPGATASTLTLAAVTGADAGSYAVTVGNALGSVTSSAASLTVTVTLPVTLTAQPQPLTVASGQTATFTVAATGTGPLT